MRVPSSWRKSETRNASANDSICLPGSTTDPAEVPTVWAGEPAGTEQPEGLWVSLGLKNDQGGSRKRRIYAGLHEWDDDIQIAGIRG